MFAVAIANLYTNQLVLEIIEAETWHDALLQHSLIRDDKFFVEPGTLEEVKKQFLNCDWLIAVEEVP